MTPSENIARDDAPIFLVGFMGAGKTTVGQALARLLGFEFLDLDQSIEAQTGKTVSEIFRELGESEFRRLERDAILRCRDLRRAVIALGGGAYVSEENRRTLRGIGKTIWLDCPLEVCLSRIGGDQTRPLLGDRDRMATLLNERRETYEKADYVIGSDQQTPGELAQKIMSLLGHC